MPDLKVCRAADIPPGGRKLIPYKTRAIGVFNVDGEFYAVWNYCPHHRAEVCRGRLGGTMVASRPHQYRYGLDGRVLACPWHHWEFDLQTGRSLTDPEGYRLKTFPVTIDDGDVVVHV